MRLYCPTCRETFEEPQDRYDRLGGRIPCRVCRTTLEQEDGGASDEMISQVFTVGDDGKTTMLTMEDLGLGAGKTTILETPSEEALRSMGLVPDGLPQGPPPGPAPGHSSGPIAPPNFGPPPGQPSYSSNPSGPVAPPNFGPPPGLAPYGGQGSPSYGNQGNPPSGPVAPPNLGPPPGHGGYPNSPSGPVAAPNFGPPPVASPQGAAPQGYGPPPVASAQGPQPQSSGGQQGGQFHANPTYIFPTQDPGSSGVGQVGGAPPGAPPGFQGRMSHQPHGGGGAGHKTMPQSAVTPPGGDGRAKHKKKVVIGGAAADQKTQMFNAADFAMIASQNSSQEMPPFGGAPAGPPPMQPVGAGGGHQPVVVEVPGGAAPPSTDTATHQTVIQAPNGRKGGALKLIVLIIVVLGLIGGGAYLVMDYINSGSSGESGGDAEGGASDAPRIPANRLLQNLRDADFVRPVYTSGGASPADYAMVLGAMPNSTGDTYYWLSTPEQPAPTELSGGLAGSLPATDLPLYVVFDGSTPANLVIETLGAVQSAGLSPWLVAGSPMGTDIHYLYNASATSATMRIRLGAGSVSISSAGWPEPRVLCYGSTLPLMDLRRVLDEVFGTGGVNDGAVSIGIDMADGVALQNLFNLMEGIERAGVSYQIGVTASAAPTCP